MELELLVVMYHYVRDPGDAVEAGSGIPGLPVAQFEAQLEALSRRWQMVSWPAVQAHLLGQAALPPRACLLTFDDGVLDHYHHVFPCLSERGLSGLFFALARQPGDGLALGHKLHFLLARLGLAGLRQALHAGLDPAQSQALLAAEARYQARAGAVTDEVDAFKTTLQRDLSADVDGQLSRLIETYIGPEVEVAAAYYLSPTQIAEMAASGMHFGGHSRTHPWLDWVDGPQLAQELAASAAWLSEVAPGPWPFAYPYGGYDERTPSALAAQDFCAAFTTVPHVRHPSPFHIGRLDGEALSPDLDEAEWPIERLPAGSRYG